MSAQWGDAKQQSQFPPQLEIAEEPELFGKTVTAFDETVEMVEPPTLASTQEGEPWVKRAQEPPKGMYEVCTGLVAVRAGPSTQTESLGVLKGGHRFYARPYTINGRSWLKLQTECLSPPLFSPSNHRRRGLGPPGAEKHFAASVPDLFSPPSSPSGRSLPFLEEEAEEDAWVRNQSDCVMLIRLARGEVMNGRGQVWAPETTTKPHCSPVVAARQLSSLGSLASTPKTGTARPGDIDVHGSKRGSHSSVSRHSSKQSYCSQRSIQAASVNSIPSPLAAEKVARILSRSRSAPIDADAWAGCGPGAFVNTRRYGVHGSPPNTNCGRWRQLCD